MDRKYRLTGGFSSLGEFLVAIRRHTDGKQASGKLTTWVQKVQSESTDSAGGFLVPEQFATEIYGAVMEASIVRSRAIGHKMLSDTLNIPVLVDSDRSSSIFGGITTSWLEEAGDKTTGETDPVLGNLKLTAKELVASTYVGNNLEDDYEGGARKPFEDFIKIAFGRAIAFEEDDAFIWGNGVGQPLGIMNSSGIITPARAGIGKVDITDIGTLASRLLPGSWASAVWMISQSVLLEYVNMTASAANSQSVVNLNTMTILGRPIIVTEKCQTAATLGDIILADWKNGYVVGDRQLEIAGSRDVPSGGFLDNKTFWRIVMRVDGQPVLNAAITPRRGGSTLSHFVALTTTS